MSSIVFPAEWEPQTGVLISWPAESTDWRDQLAEVEETYLALAEIIIAHGHLYVCCCDAQTQSHVEQLCNQQGMPPEHYTLITIPYNDTWTRDYGPISVRIDEQPTWLDFKYNAWGGKFSYQQDNRLTQSLYQQEFMTQRRYISCDDFVLEGGSIDSDGDGTLLTTSQCLLSPGRNPALSKQQIEEHLQTVLGIKRVLWLDHGHLIGDDTDGHIDTLARFCATDTIAYVACTNPDDPHFLPLSAMAEQLRSFRQMNGEPYRLIPLPLPDACFSDENRRLPASYANFLIFNGAVLVPVYDVDSDSYALAQLQKCFPAYTIIPVMCRSLIEQYGSLHCITMQLL